MSLNLKGNPFHSSPETVLSLLQVCLSSNHYIIRTVKTVLQELHGISPIILSFLIQEEKHLSAFTFFQLLELVNVDDVSLAQLKALHPLLFSFLLSSSSSSDVILQAKQALKRLEDKDRN
ncbi:MAG: hypothetical protein ACFFC7_30225 [Candidatus Hermodarchaeota archaeon]